MFTPANIKIIHFAMNTYSLILEFIKQIDSDDFQNHRISMKIQFYFYIDNEIIGIDDTPIFMKIHLIEIEESFHIPTIQQIGDAILEKYSSITDGKNCVLSDEILILNMSLINEKL